MLVHYFVPFIVSNRYILFWVSNGHNSVTVQNRTHVYMNFFDHKDLGNHLQLCPKVVKHPVYWRVGLRLSWDIVELILTYLPFTYLLAPWSWVLLEKLTGFQLVKKFPPFYGTRRFITSFTSACHLSLSWASWVQSMPNHPTSWRCILMVCKFRLQLHVSAARK